MRSVEWIFAVGWVSFWLYWLIAAFSMKRVALAAGYFGYSATVEERYMTIRFPDDYPRYKDSTKMLVPFVF